MATITRPPKDMPADVKRALLHFVEWFEESGRTSRAFSIGRTVVRVAKPEEKEKK
jgi:hypothetical protein